jgi:hypothetical protein
MHMSNGGQHRPRSNGHDLGARQALIAGALEAHLARIDVVIAPLWNGQKLTATYHVESVGSSRGSYLLFDYTTCPFPVVDIESTAGEARDGQADFGERVFVISCVERLVDSTATIQVVMEWPIGLAERDMRGAYLAVPDSLPRLVTPPTDSITRQPLVHVEMVAPEQFAHASLGFAGAPTENGDDAQLQVVLLPAQNVRSIRGSRIVFSGDAVTEASEATLARTAREFETMLGFLGAELGIEPTVQLAVIADSRATKISDANGVVLAAVPDHFGIGTDDLRLFRSQGVLNVAGIWWGAGVRMYGDLGIAVLSGIGQAMVFRRLTADQNERDLRVVLKGTRRLADMPLASGASAAERQSKFGIELALRIFEATQRDPGVARELRKMTQEYWGHEVTADLVLSRLAAGGVSVPSTRYGLR